MPAVWIRQASREDEKFLFSLYALCRPELQTLFGMDPGVGDTILRQQYALSQESARRRYPDAVCGIIMLRGKAAGKFFVSGTEEIHIIELGLLPEYRNRGIGSLLIRGLLQSAAARGGAVSLEVARFNVGAIRLYERLGFFVSEDNGAFLRMRQDSKQP